MGQAVGKTFRLGESIRRAEEVKIAINAGKTSHGLRACLEIRVPLASQRFPRIAGPTGGVSGVLPAPPATGKNSQRSAMQEPSPRTSASAWVVIVVVTVLILLISLAAYGFVTFMQMENKAAFARGDQLQAQSVAASGREYLAAFLELPREQRPAKAAWDDAPELFGNVLVDAAGDEADASARQGRFSLLAPSRAEFDGAWLAVRIRK